MRQERESAAKRGYGSRWQKARATFLQANPLCRICEKAGRLTCASVVDHIKPHKGDQRLFWDSANWQPLCKDCHDSTKRRFEVSGVHQGCDVNGMPLDAHARAMRLGLSHMLVPAEQAEVADVG